MAKGRCQDGSCIMVSGAQKQSLVRDNYIGGLYNGDEDANESCWQSTTLCRWYMIENDLKPVYKKGNITKLIANKTAESWKENEKSMISEKLREIMLQEENCHQHQLLFLINQVGRELQSHCYHPGYFSVMRFLVS